MRVLLSPGEARGSGGSGIPTHHDVELVTAEQLGSHPARRPWGGEGP